MDSTRTIEDVLTERKVTNNEHNDPSGFVQALSKLKEANLLTQENFDAVKKHNNPYSFSIVLSKLKEVNLLTQENFNAVKKHNDPFNFVQALSKLKEANLLTQEYFNAVKEHNDPSGLRVALSRLKEVKLLTQGNFTQLLGPNPNVLLTLRIEGNLIWNYLPGHLLTQEIFNELIRRASLPNPEHLIQQYITIK